MSINKWKIIVTIIGGIPLFFSFLFWKLYGRPGIIPLPIPPVTTIITFTVYFLMLFLMFNTERIEIIFGKKGDARRNILHILGVIFTGFILVITISWGLIAGKIENINATVYFQSYILAGLFFYVVVGFYIILIEIR